MAAHLPLCVAGGSYCKEGLFVENTPERTVIKVYNASGTLVVSTTQTRIALQRISKEKAQRQLCFFFYIAGQLYNPCSRGWNFLCRQNDTLLHITVK